MSYQLNVDQILEGLRASQHPGADGVIRLVENVVSHAALLLAKHLDVECGAASFEGCAFAGTCVAFHPKAPGDPLPDVFAEHRFDHPEEWG